MSVLPGRLITDPPGKTEPARFHGLHVKIHSGSHPVNVGAVLILASPPVEKANHVLSAALY